MKQLASIILAFTCVLFASCKQHPPLGEKLTGHWTDQVDSEYETIRYEYNFEPNGTGTYTHSIVSKGGHTGIMEVAIRFTINWKLDKVNSTKGQLNLTFTNGKKLTGKSQAEEKFVADMIALKNGQKLNETITIDDNGKLRFLLGNEKVKVFTRKH